jgi:hypothetical protein
MKLKQLALGIALNLALISTAVHADIIFQSKKAGENICDNLSDSRWAGSGTVSTKILGVKITCTYQGTTHITAKGGPYAFQVDVDLKKDSGVCPASESVSIPGICDPVAGVIVLSSSEAQLSGKLSSDGKAADLTGKVYMSVMGKSVTADVEKMHLDRQS